MNKTSISSVVCLDVLDFSKKSKDEQQAIKKQLHQLIDRAVIDIPEKDRMVLDTKNGAIVTCSGALESALEDALFIALTIRDEVLNTNIGTESPLYLVIGINLGSVRLDPNVKAGEAPKVIGEGLIEAQRIMSFANSNQILVSRAYYEMASKLTLEVAQMFEKYDMHAYEHDIYAVRRLNEKSVVENAAAALDHIEKPQEDAVVASTFNWPLYFLPALLALIMFFVLLNWMKSDEAEYMQDQLDTDAPVVEGAGRFGVDVLPEPLPEILPEPIVEGSTSETKTVGEKLSAEKKKPAVKAVKKMKKAPAATVDTAASSPTVEPAGQGEAAIEAPSRDDDQSTWDTLKEKGNKKPACSQAQRALNQCE